MGVGVGAADGAEADADAGGEVAQVVGGERALEVDGVVAVAAEERPVLDAEDEGGLVLADVTARRLALPAAPSSGRRWCLPVSLLAAWICTSEGGRFLAAGIESMVSLDSSVLPGVGETTTTKRW